MHFLEAGLDRQASTLLRIVAVALRVAEIEEEEVNASEQSEEAGSARHLDAASAELIAEAKEEGRLEEEELQVESQPCTEEGVVPQERDRVAEGEQ